MRLPLLLVAALLAAAAVPCCWGIPYVQDELLWTKQDWLQYKLPFPWSTAMKQRDVESTRQLQGPLRGFPLNSMNGPLLDGAAVAQAMEEDSQRQVWDREGGRVGVRRRPAGVCAPAWHLLLPACTSAASV